MKIKSERFGKTKSGQVVTRHTLSNQSGMEVSILDLGGIIQRILVADRRGNFGDVVLGCDSVADYEQQSAYFGCVVGRFANRINKGQLTVEGRSYALACNNGANHLHGGAVGF